MPEISLIVPIYNVEEYLDCCLKSILAQTYKDFEIICADDGSTDNSMKIVENYAESDDRIKIIHLPHTGAAEARNAGLEAAVGKYVQFLDSDDFFEPEMLERLHSAAVRFNSDMTVCSCKKTDEFGNVIESSNPLNPINLSIVPFEKPFCAGDFPEEILSVINPAPWLKLYLKELITGNGIRFQNLSSCNDVSFAHKTTLCASRIAVISGQLVNYRFGRRGSIAQNRTERAQNVIDAGVDVKEFMLKKGFFERYKAAYYKAFTKHFRAEISKCSKEQLEEFLKTLKRKMPEDYDIFYDKLDENRITPEYLHKLAGESRVMLWGASFYIGRVLEDEKIPHKNILGIIDRNLSVCGSKCGNYTIYPPEILDKLKPDKIIVTVYSNNELVYPEIKKFIETNYPEIKVEHNIFAKGSYE